MALLTDGTISSIEDLNGYDTQLLTVANTEGINLTQKLALAKEEIILEVSGLLSRMSGWGTPGWIGVSTLPIDSNGARALGNVVVTRPLKLWHTFRALELVYQDAYNSQLNDRYAGKRDQNASMVLWAHEKLVQAGLGMVWKPIPQAAAPNVQVTTGSLPDGTYYVAAAWTNAAGEQGASSAPSQIQVSGGTFQVTAGAVPKHVVGWNVYAGGAPNALTLQNLSPAALQTTFVQPDVMSITERLAGTGQEPNYVQPVPRVIQRG